MLRSLTAADSTAFHDLLQRNAAHLTRFGDYRSAVTENVEHWVEELSATDARLDFGSTRLRCW